MRNRYYYVTFFKYEKEIKSAEIILGENERANLTTIKNKLLNQGIKESSIYKIIGWSLIE